MTQTITVMYTCSGCGLHKRQVKVKARTTEDVSVWVENIMGPAIADDHFRTSPHCRSSKMDEVFIPMTGANKVGGAPIQ